MMKKKDDVKNDQRMKFPTTCPSCGASTDTDMCVIDIPHFKEAIIMSLTCEKCGYKSNEVKGGGEISSHATRVTLRAETAQDMSRAVVKSDSACLAIPEIDLELKESGSGVYTTVEGLLMKIHDGLKQASPFASTDGESSTNHDKFDNFLSELKNMAEGNRLPFTLIITDPISNSFIGPIPEGGHSLLMHQTDQSIPDDKRITIEEIHRSREQNDMFGLNDMRT
jgi:zinc finger protein